MDGIGSNKVPVASKLIVCMESKLISNNDGSNKDLLRLNRKLKPLDDKHLNFTPRIRSLFTLKCIGSLNIVPGRPC